MIKIRILFICLCFTVLSWANQEPQLSQRKTLCLNMIVKNESRVIERCLGSLKHLVDYWVIVDTGSMDETREIIKKCMHGIPGELHERQWVNFAHNRNEALALAKNKGDYLLFVDADEILEYSDSFVMPSLDKDFYHMTVRQINAADVKRIGVINNHLDWKWQGDWHEVLESSQAKSHEVLKGVINYCNTGPRGGRSKGITDTQKYFEDAKALEKALEKDPSNSRYAFYLGQSYLAAEKYELAKKAFEKRIAMESADVQETYMALYDIGLIYEKLNDFESAIRSFFKAYEFRPSRAEPLFRIAVLYRKQGNYLLGYLLSKHALSFSYPAEDVCVEYMTYDYALRIEFANCSLLLGRYEEGLQASCQLLANPNLPENIKGQVVSNCELARTKLRDMAKTSP
jgi:glycosyltransferase involved in cell wall biosynthesis